jgi:glycosyltransferase involved in cell wall biosynthesis
MHISAVIACRNAARTIGRQIEAVATQAWHDGFDIIVVDNRSTDESPCVVQRYMEQFPFLRLITANERLGAGYARNCGVRASTADAVVFCDADDEVAPGWLAAMGRALDQHDFVACRIDVDKINDPRIAGTSPHPQSSGLQRMPYPPYLPHAGGGTLGIRRALHDEIGGFDEEFRFVQDTHYCLKAQLAGRALHFVPEARVHVRMRDTLNGTFRQARGWGQYSVRLYRESLKLGTEPLPHPVRYGVQAWLSILRTLPGARHRDARRKWVFQLGYRVGRLAGTLLYMTVAP